ncbi:MAG: HPr(Ser) kinase/phosphatase [Balneolaceae bacterium]
MPFKEHSPIPRKEKISVHYLIDQMRERLHLDLQPLASEREVTKHFVTETELHRPGLALAGYIDLFTWKRIQIVGNTESNYLANLSEKARAQAFANILKFDLPVLFLTSGNKLSDPLVELADRAGIPVYRTEADTTQFMVMLRDFLEDQFALQTLVHGTMVDVYGIGILISGKSGIGKSEVALDLLERGHRLVADDAVMLSKKNHVLMASATEINKHFMEIRGLGIIDAMSMFGIRSIRYQKRLEVILNLTLWDEQQNVERTGLDHDNVTIMDNSIPLIHLPMTPGKNITVIAEVIAMNYLLEHYGYDAAEAFQEKVKKHIANKENRSDMPRRAIEYFEGDVE